MTSISESGQLLFQRRLTDKHIFSTAIDPQTDRPIKEPEKLAAGSYPLWSPSGKRIAYITKGVLHTMSADGRDDQAIIKVDAAIHGAETYAWAPDDDTMYFPQNQERL